MNNNVIIFIDTLTKKKFIINCKMAKTVEKIKLEKYFFKLKKINIKTKNNKIKKKFIQN